MPELPDVARFKTYLDSTSLHKRVRRVKVVDRDVLEGISAWTLQQSLKNCTFESTTRHGKFLFVRCEEDVFLVLHFGMTGYLDYGRQDGDSPRHTRVNFRFDNDYRLAYVCQRKLGRVTLTESPGDFAEKRQLGLDALDEDLDHEEFQERFAGRRGTVKSALMNQSILAGIGNVYADEILFQAGINPGKHVDQLGDAALRDLYRVIRRVLQTAVRKNAEVSKLPHGYLLPHRDSDGHCPRCGGRLRKTKVSGRPTYSCPNCQN